jgi:hypothetical protein
MSGAHQMNGRLWWVRKQRKSIKVSMGSVADILALAFPRVGKNICHECGAARLYLSPPVDVHEPTCPGWLRFQAIEREFKKAVGK